MEFSEPKPAQNEKEKGAILLEKINKAFESLGISARWEEFDLNYNDKIEGCDNLKEKKIVMIDDLIDELKGFIPDLTIVSEGNAYFILHKDQHEGGLVRQVLEIKPDIVLVDRNLANGLKGEGLTQNIKRHLPGVDCIGFSNEDSEEAEEAFLKAGAKGLVLKEKGRPERSIKKISKIISEK